MIGRYCMWCCRSEGELEPRGEKSIYHNLKSGHLACSRFHFTLYSLCCMSNHERRTRVILHYLRTSTSHSPRGFPSHHPTIPQSFDSNYGMYYHPFHLILTDYLKNHYFHQYDHYFNPILVGYYLKQNYTEQFLLKYLVF